MITGCAMLHTARFTFWLAEPVPPHISKAFKATTGLAIWRIPTIAAIGCTGLAFAAWLEPEAILTLHARLLVSAREAAWSAQSASDIPAGGVQNKATCTGGAA